MKKIKKCSKEWWNGIYHVELIEDDTIEITTHFLDYINDAIQFYITKTKRGTYEVTDGGFIIWDLQANGYELDETYVKTLKNMMNVPEIIINNLEIKIIIEDEEDLERMAFRYAEFLSVLSNSIATIYSSGLVGK